MTEELFEKLTVTIEEYPEEKMIFTTLKNGNVFIMSKQKDGFIYIEVCDGKEKTKIEGTKDSYYGKTKISVKIPVEKIKELIE